MKGNMPVTPLSKNDLIAMFTKYIGDSRVISEADLGLVRKFIDEMADNTLAVELLSKAAADNPKKTIQDLVGFDNPDVVVSAQINQGNVSVGAVTDFIKKLYAVENISPAERKLLLHLVCLPNEFVAYEDYKTLMMAADFTDNLGDIYRDLRALFKIGWLRHNKERDSYKIHGLVSKALVEQLQPSEDSVPVLLRSLSRVMERNNPAVEKLDRLRWVRFGKSVLCLLYTSPSPRDQRGSRMPSSA